MLENLTSLDISHNRLDVLPPTLALLKNLKEFKFEKNKFRKIPRSMIDGGINSLFDYLKLLLKGSQVCKGGILLISSRNCTE